MANIVPSKQIRDITSIPPFSLLKTGKGREFFLKSITTAEIPFIPHFAMERICLPGRGASLE
jgi:hypothetical protein